LVLFGLLASAYSLCLPACNGGKVCCYGKVNSTTSYDGSYYLTTFGGGDDNQPMACGGNADGSWYYMADNQRWGCGTIIQIVNPQNGNCAKAQVADQGPDICVEEAACLAIVDASPLVSEQLGFGSSSGWSEHNLVTVTISSGDIGPC